MLQGIDLSKWNSVPDYNKLSSSGLAFAYVKATQAGYQDPEFDTRHKLISETGLLNGAYHYFKADTDPIIQAEVFLRAIGNKVADGEMPPVLDIEDPNEKLTVSQYEDHVAKWLDHVEQKTAVKPMIYTGGWYWEQLKTLANSSRFKGYPLWLSSYTPTYGKMFGGWTAPKIWQYTAKGNIAGVYPVDLNYFYGSADDLWAFARMKPIAASTIHSPKAKAVQSRLSALGFYKKDIDGILGSETEKAVVAFQTSKGLVADGIIDSKSWVELFGVKTY